MDDYAALEQILTAAKTALTHLEVQAASYTSTTIPVHLKVQLDEKREEVSQLEERLARMQRDEINPQQEALIAISRPSPMRLRVPDKYYVERDTAKRLLSRFAASLQEPGTNPLLFNIYGIGGVGKTTLLGRLKEMYTNKVDFLEVCFSKTSGIETPLKLMRRIHQQAVDTLDIEAEKDVFSQFDKRFEATLFELSQKGLDGQANSSEDRRKIATWFERLVWLGSASNTSNYSKSLKDSSLEFSDSIAMGKDSEGLQEWVQHIVRNHPSTKDNLELQALMLNPASRLTQGFSESLMQNSKARKRPLVLVLDTYEKAQTYLNQWLWQYLVEDTTLYASAVRLVVIGRRSLQADEGWRKLNQDRKLLYEVPLEKFDRSDTYEYLKQIGIIHGGKRAKIFKVTQGLPYYLDWVRKQHEQGIEPDFSQGNQAIAELLLQGLDDQQKKVLQVMACCRWFDLSVIRYLLENSELEIAEVFDKPENCFEWLRKSDFVGFAKGRYALDDVARDVFRQSFYQEDQSQFRRAHGLLAAFFQQKADKVIDPQELLPECYEDEEWRKLMSESLYHGLFGKGKDGLRQYIEHLFAAAYLKQPDIFVAPFIFVSSEINKENKYLIHKATANFIAESEIAVGFGWFFLDKHPKSYKLNLEDKDGNKLPEESIEIHKKKVEDSLQTLLEHVEFLPDGLGKYAGLMSKSLRSKRDGEKRSSNLEAKRQVEMIASRCRPKLAFSLFLTIGNLLSNAETYEEALHYYAKALEIEECNVYALLSQASTLLNIKEFEQALDICQRIIEIDPGSASVWQLKGQVLVNLKQYREAVDSFEKALGIDPKSYDSWVHQGFSFLELEQYEHALNSFQEATQLNPGLALGWNLRGEVLLRLERHEEALNDCQKAVEVEPKSIHGWELYANVFFEIRRYDEALVYCKKTLEIDPESGNGLNLISLVLSILGDFEKALVTIDEAINLAPENVLFKANKGIILVRSGRFSDALFECDQVIEKFPDNESGYYAKACYYALYGNVDKAIDSLRNAISIRPRHCRYSAKHNPDFDNIRNDERFRSLMLVES